MLGQLILLPEIFRMVEHTWTLHPRIAPHLVVLLSSAALYLLWATIYKSYVNNCSFTFFSYALMHSIPRKHTQPKSLFLFHLPLIANTTNHMDILWEPLSFIGCVGELPSQRKPLGLGIHRRAPTGPAHRFSAPFAAARLFNTLATSLFLAKFSSLISHLQTIRELSETRIWNMLFSCFALPSLMISFVQNIWTWKSKAFHT